jgi:hypothetical protein
MKTYETTFMYLTLMLILSVFFGLISWNMTFLFSGLTGIGCITFMHGYYGSQMKGGSK